MVTNTWSIFILAVRDLLATMKKKKKRRMKVKEKVKGGKNPDLLFFSQHFVAIWIG